VIVFFFFTAEILRINFGAPIARVFIAIRTFESGCHRMSFGTSRVYRCENTVTVKCVVSCSRKQSKNAEKKAGRSSGVRGDMASYANTCKSSISVEIERW